MNLYLIRHLPTEGNEKRQYIGSTDEELSEKGKQQYLAKRRTPPTVDRIVASPMKRCIQTALLLWPEGADLMVRDSLLRECDFGAYEGKTFEELKEEPDYIQWLQSGGTLAFPGGESQKDFRYRCLCGFQRAVKKGIDDGIKEMAFVVHGGTIMAILSQLSEEKKDFYDWQVENGNGFETKVEETEWRESKGILHQVRKIQWS